MRLKENKGLGEPEIIEEAEKEVKPITMEGAYRLAAAILMDAYNSYKEALEKVMKIRKYVAKILPIIRTWDAYQLEKKEVNQIKQRIKARKGKWALDEEKERIEKFKTYNKPKAPTSYQINKFYEWCEATSEKAKCEAFYKSIRYIRLTLGKGVPAQEIIATIQKEIGWKEE